MNSWTRNSFAEQLSSPHLFPNLKSNSNIFEVNTQSIPTEQNVSFLIKLIQKKLKSRLGTILPLSNVFRDTVH